MATFRPPIVAAMLALCAVLASAATADERRPGTYQNLIDRGHRLLAKAQEAYVRGDAEAQHTFAGQAEAVFVDATRLQPRDRVAAFMGGQAAAFSGKLARATPWIERLRSLTPYGENDPDLHYLRAFATYFAANRPYSTIQWLRKMVAVNPRARPLERDTLYYLALLSYGNDLIRKDRHEDAVQQFSEAARVSRRRGWRRKELAARGSVGITYRIGTDWKKAVEVFDALIAEDPGNVLWHWHRGLALGSQLDFDEAIPSYRRVIELRSAGRVLPTHEADIDMVFLRLGNCLRNLATGQKDAQRRKQLFTEAKEAFETYIELRPKDVRGHKWLGTLYYPDSDDPYGAIPHFKKAFEVDPMCSSSLRSLIQIYERYPPVPVEDPEAAAKARAAWAAQLAAWRKDLEEGVERRAAALKKREDEALDGDNGCD